MALRTEHCRYEWDDGLDPELYERSPLRDHIALKQFYQRDVALAQEWCDANGYTELHIKDDAPHKFWAYPPNGVMAVPINLNECRVWKQLENGNRFSGTP